MRRIIRTERQAAAAKKVRITHPSQGRIQLTAELQQNPPRLAAKATRINSGHREGPFHYLLLMDAEPAPKLIIFSY
jgi:hypothetical protein